MPETPDTSNVRAQLEIEQMRASISKMLAEQLKLNAEHERLGRENSLWYFGLPAVATIIGACIIAIIGALVTVTVAFIRVMP